MKTFFTLALISFLLATIYPPNNLYKNPFYIAAIIFAAIALWLGIKKFESDEKDQ